MHGGSRVPNAWTSGLPNAQEFQPAARKNCVVIYPPLLHTHRISRRTHGVKLWCSHGQYLPNLVTKTCG